MIQGTVVKVSEVAYGPLVTFLTSPKPLGQFYQTLLKILLNYWIQGFFLNEGQHPLLKEMKKTYTFLWKKIDPHWSPTLTLGSWFEHSCIYATIACIVIKIDPNCSPTITLINHDSNKLESTLSEDASTRVSFFLARWFLKIPHLEQLKRTCSNVSKNVFSTCIHYFSYKFHDTCQRRVFTL